MKKLLHSAILAALLLILALPASAQQITDYDRNAYGTDTQTSNGVIATVIDFRQAHRTNKAGTVSLENTNNYAVRVKFKVYGVTASGSRTLTTEKDVTVSASSTHNEVFYYSEDGNKDKYKSFKISITVKKVASPAGPENATEDLSPSGPTAPSFPINGGKTGSGRLGNSHGGLASGSHGGFGNVPSPSGSGHSAPSLPSSPSTPSAPSSPSSSSSSSSGDFATVLGRVKSSSATQDDYAAGIKLLSSLVDQAESCIRQISNASNSGNYDEAKNIERRNQKLLDQIDELGNALEKVDNKGKLNSTNAQKFHDIKSRIQSFWN